MQRQQLIDEVEQFTTEGVIPFVKDVCEFLMVLHEVCKNETYEGTMTDMQMFHHRALWFHTRALNDACDETNLLHQIKGYKELLLNAICLTDEPLSSMELELVRTLLSVTAEAIELKQYEFNQNSKATQELIFETDYEGSDGNTYHVKWYENCYKTTETWHSCESNAPDGVYGHADKFIVYLEQQKTKGD